VNQQPDPAKIDRNIAALIDHTILKPDAIRADILRICDEALRYGFASVCVNGFWVPAVSTQLSGSSVKVCTVVGFPFGAMTTEAKLAETQDALRKGAHEIDMVLNIGALRGGEFEPVKEEIEVLAQACHDRSGILKVILETALLTDDQKVDACRISVEAGADFVKTSTGFGPSGATTADVALMRKTVGPRVGVKASGGIRTLENLRDMVAAGATRIGASAGIAMVAATV